MRVASGAPKPLTAAEDDGVDREVQEQRKGAQRDVISSRTLDREPSSKHVMLKKSFRVGLDSAQSPLCLLPRGERATEVERQRPERPDDGCHLEEHEPRPAKNEQAAEQNKSHIGRVDDAD